MAKQKDQTTNSIFEERTHKMISHKDGKPSERTGRFLKPCANSINQAVKLPNTPLLSEFFGPQNLQQWPSKVHFKGWRMPQRRWKEWVDKLSIKYRPIWKQTGIFDAIMSSTYELRSNHDLVLGLSEFWCSETNAFAFPWGEATITLEDVMILGGLPVLGEPVTSPVTGDLGKKIEEELNLNRLELSRTKSRKASHSGWLQHFVERESESELQHVAFLSLWLSRYVFPCIAEKTMGKYVFTIAIHLSSGTPVALAPAVLASLYHDLRLLQQQAINSVTTIVVSGPFQLVQLWAIEHFPILGPCLPNSLQPGEPRTARWHKLSSKISLPLVRSVVKLADNFQWRPYAADLKNWRRLSYYNEVEEQYMYHCLNLDEELQSFVQCLCACELTGLHCKEKYMPHRVAMQLGFDQDLPGELSDLDFICLNVGFFVPARTFEPGVSARYLDWWKESKLIREDAIKDLVLLQLQERSVKSSVVPPSVLQGSDSVALKCSEKGGNLAMVPIKSEGKVQSSSFSTEFDFGTTMMDGYLTEDEFPLSSRSEARAANKTTMKSNVSRPFQAKKNEDYLHIPVALKNLQDSQNKQFPANIKKEQDHSAEDSSDDDHIPISQGLKKTSPHQASPCKQFQKVISPTSSDAIENKTRKRALSTTTRINRSDDLGEDEQVKSKAGNSANDQDGVVKKVKKEEAAGHSMDDPIEIDNVMEEIGKRKASKGSVTEAKVTNEGEKKMLGDSLDNAIDLDDDNMETTTTSGSHKHGVDLDLEGRVKKLEKILGVTLQ